MSPRRMMFAVWPATLLGFVASSRSDTADVTLLGGAGPALVQPFGLVVVQPCPSSLASGGNQFLQTVDVDPGSSQLWVAGGEQFLSVDPNSGTETPLGRFEYGSGYQWVVLEDSADDEIWLQGPVSLSGVTDYPFTLSGSVRLFDLGATEPLSVHDVFVHGSSPVPIVEGVVFEQEYHFPEDGPVEQSATLRVTLLTNGAFQIEFANFTGDGSAEFQGDLTVETEGAKDAHPLIRQVTGLARSTDDKTLVLTDAGSEPGGLPLIYAVESDSTELGPVVQMTPVVTVQTDAPRSVWSLEIAPDGTCYVAGEDVYTLDLRTGLLQLAFAPDIGPLIDMDISADGVVRAITHGDDGETHLYKLDLALGTGDLILTLADDTLWGMAVVDRSLGDLNGDGEVNDADLNIYGEQYTGSLAGPHVPPGPGTSWLSDPILVPFMEEVAFPSLDSNATARIPLDGADSVFPGIVVSGQLLSRDKGFATAHLVHDEFSIYVALDIVDDDLTDDKDFGELYLDANNSDLPEREGNEYGFRAYFTPDEHSSDDISRGGDALSAWGVYGLPTLSTYAGHFEIFKDEVGAETGGTYGFDLAIKDYTPADEGEGATTHYFLFSTTSDGETDERQWGHIKLAAGPLSARATTPSPADGSEDSPTTVALSWAAADQVLSHNVFLGAERDELVFQGNVSDSSIVVSELSLGGTYFWRVDQAGENGIRTGMVWRFTTAYATADLDRDGDVDEADLSIIQDDPILDSDGDDVVNCLDNCASLPNPDQADCDADLLGDICAIAFGVTPDCNGNLIPDSCDIASQTSSDCSINGIPDECEEGPGKEPDCNANNVADFCDIQSGISQDCNENVIPDECDVASGDVPDCNGNESPDACDIESGISTDCAVNGIPDECDIAEGTEPDCNGNGITDACDLLNATSEDCNGNAIPDECDITEGVEPDCNANLIPDGCDLLAGTSRDCTVNGVPDECDIAEGRNYDCQPNGVPDDCELDGVLSDEWFDLARSETSSSDYFGAAVATHEALVVVGAYGDDIDGMSNAGSAYVFRYDSTEDIWVEEAKLTAAVPSVSAALGESVATDGEKIIVGAFGDNAASPGAGAAHIFRYDEAARSWVEEAKLLAGDPNSSDAFGGAVAIDGDEAWIGADADNEAGSDSGAVYRFHFNGAKWSQTAKIMAKEPGLGDRFGASIRLDGNLAVVGAYLNDDVAGNAGAVYVFEFDGTNWLQTTKLVPDDELPSGYFGRELDLHEDTLLVGAYGNADGAAYVFRRDPILGMWQQEVKFLPLGATSYFGRSVAVDGSRAYIGAPFDEDSFFGAGALFTYFKNEELGVWYLESKSPSPNPQLVGYFGWSMAAHNDQLVIGAYGEYDYSGRAYLRPIFGNECNANGVPDNCEPDADSDGVPDGCDPNFCSGDANGDGAVDPLDVGFVIARFGCDIFVGDPDCTSADQNFDGVVDPLDSGFVLSRLNTCDLFFEDQRFNSWEQCS